MVKGKRTTETKATQNKVVTMPRRDSGKAEDETNRKRVGTKLRKSGLARSKERLEKEAETIKKEDYKGAKKKLRHWVKKAVKEHSPELAAKLVEDAEQGDLRCTALVVELIEKKKKGGGSDEGNEPSLAEQLMAEPTWEEVLEARRKADEEEAAEKAGAE